MYVTEKEFRELEDILDYYKERGKVNFSPKIDTHTSLYKEDRRDLVIEIGLHKEYLADMVEYLCEYLFNMDNCWLKEEVVSAPSEEGICYIANIYDDNSKWDIEFVVNEEGEALGCRKIYYKGMTIKHFKDMPLNKKSTILLHVDQCIRIDKKDVEKQNERVGTRTRRFC